MGWPGGIPTGFEDLDNLTNGLHGGQMIIVAARPGVGKSTLALDFVRSCAIKNGKAAVIFSPGNGEKRNCHAHIIRRG